MTRVARRLAHAVVFMLVLSIVPALAGTKVIRDEWMGLYVDGKRIGYQHNLVCRDTWQGKDVYRQDTCVSARISNAKEVICPRLMTRVYVGLDMAPLSLTADMQVQGSSPQQPAPRFRLEVTLSQHTGSVRISEDGKCTEQEMTLSDSLVKSLQTASAYDLGMLSIPKGTEMEALHIIPQMSLLAAFGPSFSAGIQQASKVRTVRRDMVKVSDATYDAVLTESRAADGGVTRTWRLDNGDTVKQEMPGGMVALRESRDQALKDDVLIWTTGLIECNRPVPWPARVSEFDVRFLGKLPRAAAVDDGRQTAHALGDSIEYHVVAREFDPAKSAKLPIAGGKFSKWLRPAKGIESDDPEIRTLAKQIVGNESSAYKAACRIRAWVNSNIEYDLAQMWRESLSARETLKSKKGVCTDFALLYTALARAAGIPTKVVGGLYGSARTFDGHAWAESFVGDWVPFDSVQASDRVDAVHVKMIEGGAEIARNRAASEITRAEVISVKYWEPMTVPDVDTTVFSADGVPTFHIRDNGSTPVDLTGRSVDEKSGALKFEAASIMMVSMTAPWVILPPDAKQIAMEEVPTGPYVFPADCLAWRLPDGRTVVVPPGQRK